MTAHQFDLAFTTARHPRNGQYAALLRLSGFESEAEARKQAALMRQIIAAAMLKQGLRLMAEPSKA